MKSIFRFFACHHLLANILMVTIVLLGLSSMSTLSRDVYPYVDLGQQVIITHYPGAAPEDVELKVTNRIEEELNTVAGIERYTSVSAENLSIVHVHIGVDKRTSKIEAIQREVRDAVRRISDLPPEVDSLPNVSDIDVTSIPFLEVGIVGDVPYQELQANARRVQRVIENVPGIKKVERFGWQAREVKIEVIPEKTRDLQVSLQEIVSSIKTRNVRGSGGSFESYTSDQNIVTLAQFDSPQEVGDVVVRGGFDGPLVRIKDLAIIKDDFEEAASYGRINGKKGILLQLFKEPGADVIRLVEEIISIKDNRAELLSPEVSLEISKDSSKLVRSRINMVISNGLMGFALVLAVLTISLNWITAVWVAISIPIVLFGVLALLPIFDLGLDTLMLTSMILVLGIIVDDSIIVSESIYRQFEKGKSAVDAAVDGLYNVFFPVLITVLTTILAFSAMFFMPGIMGRFVFVVPLTIILTLSISLVEVTLILPSHLSSSLSRSRKTNQGGQPLSFIRRMEYYYSGFLIRVLRLRYLLVLLFIGVLGYSLFFASRVLGFELFPTTAADRFYIKIEAPAGTSLSGTEALVTELEQVVARLPKEEVDSFVSHIGRKSHDQEPPVVGNNLGIVFVALTPFEDRKRSAAEIMEALRKEAQHLESKATLLYEVASDGPPIGKPITLHISGPDDKQRMAAAEEILSYLQGVNGVTDLERDDKVGKDELRIVLDYSKLARLGLTAAQVAQTIRLAYDGEKVTSVRYGEDDVGFRVILNEPSRHNPDFLHTLTIPNRHGRLIALSQVASFSAGPGPLEVHHYNGLRSISITGETKDSVSPVKVLEQMFATLRLQTLYPDLLFTVGGEAEETQKSIRAQIVTLALALLGVYLLLSVFFNSVSQPFIVIAAIPYGVVGVIWTFYAHDTPFGFAALLGLIGLIGVVVNDSLVLVSRLNELQRENSMPDIFSVVAIGSADRLRPILLTTITTVAGLLPLAYGIGGVDPFMGPMALALGYGLIFGTTLTLLLVPCLYLIEHDIRRLMNGKTYA